jgi:beta-N-acetylglucosaminidase-like protein/FAD-dependent oxidoreductase family protein
MTFAMRGVIEGFYGPPWSHEERWMMLGHAAGAAAARAARRGVAVQDVDVDWLQADLRDQGQVLALR